jgi:alpha-tubulin suppressor-like RCC1 family protein
MRHARRRTLIGGVIVLFAIGAGCTSLLGIDHDYHAARGDDAGADGGANDSGSSVAETDTAPEATPQPTETFPADAGSVTKVVAGKFHSCALFASGFAKCWGRNDDYLELGNGTNVSTAVPLPAMRGGLTDLFAGAHGTCATLASGAVCAGHGEDGELGNGGDAGSAVPVSLSAFPPNPTAVSSGEAFMCALFASGEVWCVGDGTHGELGDGISHTTLAPVQAQIGGPAQAIAAFYLHACALRRDGSVACWGDNSLGQLGDGLSGSDGGVAVPVTVRGVTGATAIGVGTEHSCALVGSGRTSSAFCWGANAYGQLGDGTNRASATPVQVQGLVGATSLAVGGYHACAGLLFAGVSKCWGKGGSGELGNGKPTDAPTPVTVQSISYPASLAAGAYHTCALVASPNVVCWGSNDFGQLGNGNAPNQELQPVQVTW